MAESLHSHNSPVSAAEVAAVRWPTDARHCCRRASITTPPCSAYELESWFASGWVCVGREEDIALSGQYVLTKLCDENLIVLRDNATRCAPFSISAAIAAPRS